MPSRRSLRRAPIALAVCALLAGACSRPDERRSIHDLAAELDRAEVAVESPVLDLGAPETRHRLVAGWS